MYIFIKHYPKKKNFTHLKKDTFQKKLIIYIFKKNIYLCAFHLSSSESSKHSSCSEVRLDWFRSSFPIWPPLIMLWYSFTKCTCSRETKPVPLLLSMRVKDVFNRRIVDGPNSLGTNSTCKRIDPLTHRDRVVVVEHHMVQT